MNDLFNADQQPAAKPARKRTDEPIRASFTLRRFRCEGEHGVRYQERQPYFRDAWDWYRANVNPTSDDADLLAYVTRCAIEAGAHREREIDGIGTVYAASRDEVKLWPFARVLAMTSRGFLVELPTLRDFYESQHNTVIG